MSAKARKPKLKKENKLSDFIKYFLFCGILSFFLIMFILIITKSDLEIPQSEILINMDIKDKINMSDDSNE